MIDSHPYSPIYLGILALVFIGILTYMVMYNRRQKALLKDVEREGHHAHSVDEGILLAQERGHHHKPSHAPDEPKA
jgi:hypothetical protein